MLDVTIDPDLRAAGVPVTLGAILCALDVAPSGPALLAEMEALEAERIAWLAAGNRPADPPAVADARRAYKALGKDPSRYRPSAEALLRRLSLGKGTYRINNAVDVINLVSIRTGISIGGFDADRIQPPVALRPGAPGEVYETIGRGPINLEGLPLFADALGPFGNTTSDSDRTRIGATTRRLFMVLVRLGDDADLPAALDDAVRALVAHCAARDVETAIIRQP